MSNLAMMMGLGSGAGGVAVADVFSTDLYTGNASTQDIVNGLDLSTDGGMVWFARRNGAEEKNIFSTNAPNKYIRTTSTAAQGDITTGITAYNTDGFSLGGWNNVNGSGDTMVSWSWKQAPKFFDVQTWTGDGVAGREIPHNLSGEVGMIFVKSTSNANQWCVYNRNYGGTYFSLFPTAQAFAQSADYWNDTDATTSAFTVGSEPVVNQSGVEYVAYIFGHGDNIQCGSIVGDGTSDREIDLGFKAQWVMFKRADTNNSTWLIYDAARGMAGGSDPYLDFASNQAEGIDQDYLEATDNGFKIGLVSSGNYFNVSGQTYIYMAIKAED